MDTYKSVRTSSEITKLAVYVLNTAEGELKQKNRLSYGFGLGSGDIPLDCEVSRWDWPICICETESSMQRSVLKMRFSDDELVSNCSIITSVDAIGADKQQYRSRWF